MEICCDFSPGMGFSSILKPTNFLEYKTWSPPHEKLQIVTETEQNC